MAHFAKLDENNVVTEVVVVGNDMILENGVESEQKGKDYLNDLFGVATWVQTSYNGSMRKQYAGIGFTYDQGNDVFIKRQPFTSWTLDSNFDWQAPVAYPTDGNQYVWDEDSLSWVKPPSPFPSWTWNESEWIWEAPIPKPGDNYMWNEDTQTWDLIS